MDALLGILCLILAFRLKEVQLEASQFTCKITDRIIECFRKSFYFLTHNLRTLGLIFWNGIIGAIATLTIFFLQACLPLCGVSNTWLGPLHFFISLGGAIGASLVMKVSKWSYAKLSIVCIAGVLLGTACSMGNLPVFMRLGGFLANLCDDLLQVRTDAILNDRFHSSQRATLLSVTSLIFSAVMIILSPIAGWVFSM